MVVMWVCVVWCGGLVVGCGDVCVGWCGDVVVYGEVMWWRGVWWYMER